jgi:hypothetical protein
VPRTVYSCEAARHRRSRLASPSVTVREYSASLSVLGIRSYSLTEVCIPFFLPNHRKNKACSRATLAREWRCLLPRCAHQTGQCSALGMCTRGIVTPQTHEKRSVAILYRRWQFWHDYCFDIVIEMRKRPSRVSFDAYAQ